MFDDDHPPAEDEVFLVEAGATVGLVLAHGFASWVSTRIIGDVAEEVDPGDLLLVQIGGALAVGRDVDARRSLVAPTSVELQAARFTVAVTISAMVFLGVPLEPLRLPRAAVRDRPPGPGGRRARGLDQGVPVRLETMVRRGSLWR